MNRQEFDDRFRDALYPTYLEHYKKWTENALEFALASYIRFIEKHYGRRIVFRFTNVLPPRAASVTVEFKNALVVIYLHTHLQGVQFGTELYHTACGLIAHELAHLMLEHCKEKAYFEARMNRENGITDKEYAAFMTGADFEADMYGAILAINRAPVFERAYYYESHPFIKGAHHKQAFLSPPFQDSSLGFLRVRDLLENAGALRPPHEVLVEILARECQDRCKDEKHPIAASDLPTAKHIVEKYRARLGP